MRKIKVECYYDKGTLVSFDKKEVFKTIRHLMEIDENVFINKLNVAKIEFSEIVSDGDYSSFNGVKSAKFEFEFSFKTMDRETYEFDFELHFSVTDYIHIPSCPDLIKQLLIDKFSY